MVSYNFFAASICVLAILFGAPLGSTFWERIPSGLFLNRYINARDFEAKPELVLKHNDSVNCLAFSPNGDKIVTCCDDKVVRIWEVKSRKEILKFKTNGERLRLTAWNPDGMSIAIVDSMGVITVIRVIDAKVLLRFQAYAASISYSPDGKLLATGGRNEKLLLRIWDAHTGKLVFEPKVRDGPCNIPEVRWTKDGRRLAWLSDSLVVLDAASGQRLVEFSGHPCSPLAYNSAKAILASTIQADFPPENVKWVWNIELWDASTGKKKASLEGHDAAISCLEFSPDGKLLASGIAEAARHGELKVWSVDERRALADMAEAHASCILAMAFSPDGKSLATGGQDGEARIWNIAELCGSGKP